jgi:hypothetical protein
MYSDATTSVLDRSEIVLHVPNVSTTSAGIAHQVINTWNLIGTARRPLPSGHLIRFIYLFYTHVYKLVFILLLFRRELPPFQTVGCRR